MAYERVTTVNSEGLNMWSLSPRPPSSPSDQRYTLQRTQSALYMQLSLQKLAGDNPPSAVCNPKVHRRVHISLPPVA